MNLTQKQLKKLRTRITGSIFLKEDVKKRLLANLGNLDAGELARVEALLGHAKKAQDKLIGKIVKYDDTFTARIKHFIKAEVRRYRSGREKAHRSKEKADDILSEIQ